VSAARTETLGTVALKGRDGEVEALLLLGLDSEPALAATH